MKTVNIHEAKTQLSKLVEGASKGESFVIAKAGKPLVKVTALSSPTGGEVRRLGFMADRSPCRTTSIGWVETRFSESSAAAYEAAARYAPSALGRC